MAFVYNSRSALRPVLQWRVVRVGLVVLMLVYLLVFAQASTSPFIYFDF